jgi:hypothetical protein
MTSPDEEAASAVSSSQATLHALAGPPGSPLDRALTVGDSHAYRGYAPLIGAFPRFIARVSGPAELIADVEAGLPDGAARAEAIAIRLRRRGTRLRWGEPEVIAGAAELAAGCRELGLSSVELMRADPSLLPEMQLGTWFDGGAGARALRRFALARAITHAAPGARTGGVRPLRALADASFWLGAREAATGPEWQRLTASSYVALLYHRMAGEDRPGEEKLDISPGRFASQMRLLQRLRFTALTAERVLAFHGDSAEVLPARSVVITVDDGFRDCAEPLLSHLDHHPQLFVSTREVGGRAHWMGDEPVMGWNELGRLQQAGVRIGPHAREHRPLVEVEPPALLAEIEGSLSDLRERMPALPVLAYPNGRHDERVCLTSAQAGFAAAYTTEKGVNGAGTDPYCLKRVSVYAYDGSLAFAWKALTGQAVPPVWERWRVSRLRRRR